MLSFKSFQKGFTLIELLIVVLLVGLIYSTIISYGQRIYEYFEAMKRLEEVRVFLMEQKREAFLFGKRVELKVENGRLFTNENKAFNSSEIFFHLKEPIVFYPLGTTNGGKLTVIYKQFTFDIEVAPLTGDIQLVK